MAFEPMAPPNRGREVRENEKGKASGKREERPTVLPIRGL